VTPQAQNSSATVVDKARPAAPGSSETGSIRARGSRLRGLPAVLLTLVLGTAGFFASFMVARPDNAVHEAAVSAVDLKVPPAVTVVVSAPDFDGVLPPLVIPAPKRTTVARVVASPRIYTQAPPAPTQRSQPLPVRPLPKQAPPRTTAPPRAPAPKPTTTYFTTTFR
jgi:hypothetical protein